jgi:hypothetical protein
LDPKLIHSPFTRDDDLALWKGVQVYGKRWAIVSSKMFHSRRSVPALGSRWASTTFREFVATEYGLGVYDSLDIPKKPEQSSSSGGPSKLKKKKKKKPQLTDSKDRQKAMLRGVTMRPSGHWQAQLYFAGKSRYIGTFDTREKATLAYEIARKKLKSEKANAEGSLSPKQTPENAFNAARKAAFEGVNEKDPEA